MNESLYEVIQSLKERVSALEVLVGKPVKTYTSGLPPVVPIEKDVFADIPFPWKHYIAYRASTRLYTLALSSTCSTTGFSPHEAISKALAAGYYAKGGLIMPPKYGPQ